jgi:hypothetical protein
MVTADIGLTHRTSQIPWYKTCTAQFSSADTIAPSPHCPLLLLYMHIATHCNTQLHDSCSLLPYMHFPNTVLYSLLAGILPEHYGSISPHSGSTPSRVTSEASRIMLLDAALFCHNIIISPINKSAAWYTSNSGSSLWLAYFCLFPNLFLYLPF